MHSTYSIVVKRNYVHLLLHAVQFLLELGFHFHSSRTCVCVCVCVCVGGGEFMFKLCFALLIMETGLE